MTKIIAIITNIMNIMNRYNYKALKTRATKMLRHEICTNTERNVYMYYICVIYVLCNVCYVLCIM